MTHNNSDPHGSFRQYDGIYGYGETDGGIVYDSKPEAKAAAIPRDKEPWWKKFLGDSNK